MAVQKVSEIGSKVIRLRSLKIRKINSPIIKKLIVDLMDTMRHEDLVGIAAPQIGVGKRIFLTEVRKTKIRSDTSHLDPLRVFINPLITSRSKKEVNGYEGCGSVSHSGLFGIVKRAKRISVRAFTEEGEEFELETSGLLARVIQHEIDHLDGICFIDKVTDTKKLLGREEYINKVQRDSKK